MTTESNKRIAKNTLMLYIRMLLIMAVTLYTSRVVLNALGVDDYGIYNVVGGVVAMFSFLKGTLMSGTQRFLTFELGKRNYLRLQQTFSTTLVIHLLLAILILLLAETVGLWFLNHKMNIPTGRMYAAQWCYQFSIAASLLTIIQSPYNACIIAHERMNIYAYVSIIDVVLKLVIVYLLVTMKMDKLILYSFLVFLVNLVIVLIYIIYCRRKYPECTFTWIREKELYRPILVFSGWNMVSMFGYLLSSQGVNILLNMFFFPAINAARAIAYQINTALTSFVNNFQIAVTPQVVKLYADENLGAMNNLLYQNSRYGFTMLWLLSLPVGLDINQILVLWLKEVPAETMIMARLVIIQSLFYTFNRPFDIAIEAVGRMKEVNLFTGPLQILVLPVSYLLLKEGLPFYTPFILNIIVVILCFVINTHYLRKWIHISRGVIFKEIIRPLFFMVVLSSVLPLLVYKGMTESLWRLFVLVGVTIVSVGICSYFFVLDAKARDWLKKKMKAILSV